MKVTPFELTQDDEIPSILATKNTKNERRKSLFKPFEPIQLQDLSEVVKGESMEKVSHLLEDMVEVIRVAN